jgi:6-phosphogluconolactonase
MRDTAGVPTFAYVGCYTTKQRNGRGEGINVYRIDGSTGGFTHVQLVKDLANPSWLEVDRRRQVLYSAHGEGEVVSAFRIDSATGQLSALGGQATKGKNGVRLGVDAENRFVVLANYSSGTVASCRSTRMAHWRRSPIW